MYHHTPLTLILLLSPIMAMSMTQSSMLLCLLNLEALTLTIIMITFLLTLQNPHMESFPTLLILSLSACEASLGLALLVKSMRTHGKDNLKTLTTSKS